MNTQITLAEARKQTDKLFDMVRPSAIYDRPIAERHRIIFYLGHLEAFDWNLIGRRVLSLPSFHPEFDQLFAFGIDPDSSGLPQDQPRDWPKVEDVLAYNREVRRRLDDVCDQLEEQYLHVALEHRLMHAETLAYMLHNVPYERKLAPPAEARDDHSIPFAAAIAVPAGSAVLGCER